MAAVAYNGGSYIKLYTNGQSVKTIKYEGWWSLARLINGEIVTLGVMGKLTVMNEKLEELKKYYKQVTDYRIRSLAGNEIFIAHGNYNGVVVYYNRDGSGQIKVSEFFSFENY